MKDLEPALDPVTTLAITSVTAWFAFLGWMWYEGSR